MTHQVLNRAESEINFAIDQNDGWNKFYHSDLLREIS